MKYYALLNLAKEPFSNSPDPEFFFGSLRHLECMQQLELSIRLRRGLHAVIGDIGTGKTTLCRHLIRQLARGKDGDRHICHLFLDPDFSSAREFLLAMANSLGLVDLPQDVTERQIKEEIKNFIFENALEKQLLVTLIFDEGQKLPPFCLEILREFLNYETNQYKLVQIVIFAQEEFYAILEKMPNFADRIATLSHLGPLSFADSIQMIRFRIQQALSSPGTAPKLFSFPALLTLFALTGGYPRRIVMLCSKVLLAMIVKKKTMAGPLLVLRCANQLSVRRTRQSIPRKWAMAAVFLLLLGAVPYWGMRVALQHHNTPERANQQRARPTAILEDQRPEQNVAQQIPEPEPANAQASSTEPAKPPTERGNAAGPGPVAAGALLMAQAAQEQKLTASPPALGMGPVTFSTEVSSPQMLGEVRRAPEDILSKMIARVYGRFTPGRLDQVLAANPELKNIDRIAPGTIIRFPALKDTLGSFAKSGYLVQLDKKDTLEAAHAFLRSYPATLTPARMAPLPNTGGGFVFLITIEKSFPSENSARDQIIVLPPDLRGQAGVLSVQDLRDEGQQILAHGQPGTTL